MDKQTIISVASILFTGAVSLLVYIWRDSKREVTKDQSTEEKQRSKDDKLLREFLTKLETRTEKDFDNLFKLVKRNSEDIKSLITEFKGFKELCEVKRNACKEKMEVQ